MLIPKPFLRCDIVAARIQASGLRPPCPRNIRQFQAHHLRSHLNSGPINVIEPADGDYARAYQERHQQLYGYVHSSRPLEVVTARWPFLESLGQRDIFLELATRVAPSDYRWRLGRTLPVAGE